MRKQGKALRKVNNNFLSCLSRLFSAYGEGFLSITWEFSIILTVIDIQLY